MSNPRTLTYKEMLWQAAGSLNLVPDASIGATVMSSVDSWRLSVALSNAARWAYYPNNNNVIWPELVLSKTITLTSGAFNLSDVDYHTRFALWSGDPRPFGSQVYPITCSQSGSSFYPAAPVTSLFCLYLPQPPQFTSVAYDNTLTYQINDVVYDATSGNCYRSLVANTPGSTLTDTTKWQPQLTIAMLAQAIQTKATAYYLDAAGSDDQASRAEMLALEFRDQAWAQTAHLAPTLELQRWFTKAPTY
jgi:hypothetical protein